MTMHSSNIRAHAAFVLIASMLAMQGCGQPVSAAPAVPAPAAAVTSVHPTERVIANTQIEAGRYLVKIGGCNDCHTPGYMETNAKLAEDEWLVGGSIGYAGPWGVSYAANLRLSLQTMTEEEFITLAREGAGRPPMPWPSLMSMSDADLSAIYVYIRSLGPKGVPAPAALSPGVAPDRPHLVLMPQMPPISKAQNQ